MKAELNDKTIVACNPLGIGQTRPGKCVHAALTFIGTGKTVAEYREYMEEWGKKHPTPHMAFPSGGSPMSVLRFLVDVNKKAVVIDKKPLKGKGKAKHPPLPKAAKKAQAERKRKEKVAPTTETPPASAE